MPNENQHLQPYATRDGFLEHTSQRELATSAIQILFYTLQLCLKVHQMQPPQTPAPSTFHHQRSSRSLW